MDRCTVPAGFVLLKPDRTDTHTCFHMTFLPVSQHRCAPSVSAIQMTFVTNALKACAAGVARRHVSGERRVEIGRRSCENAAPACVKDTNMYGWNLTR